MKTHLQHYENFDFPTILWKFPYNTIKTFLQYYGNFLTTLWKLPCTLWKVYPTIYTVDISLQHCKNSSATPRTNSPIPRSVNFPLTPRELPYTTVPLPIIVKDQVEDWVEVLVVGPISVQHSYSTKQQSAFSRHPDFNLQQVTIRTSLTSKPGGSEDGGFNLYESLGYGQTISDAGRGWHLNNNNLYESLGYGQTIREASRGWHLNNNNLYESLGYGQTVREAGRGWHLNKNNGHC